MDTNILDNKASKGNMEMVFLHEKVKDFSDKILESNKKIVSSDSNVTKYKNLNNMNDAILELIQVHSGVIKSLEEIKTKLRQTKTQI